MSNYFLCYPDQCCATYCIGDDYSFHVACASYEDGKRTVDRLNELSAIDSTQHECSCGTVNCSRADAEADILVLLRSCLSHYPASMFPSPPDGGDIMSTSGAAARWILTKVIRDIEGGEHVGESLNV